MRYLVVALVLFALLESSPSVSAAGPTTVDYDPYPALLKFVVTRQHRRLIAAGIDSPLQESSLWFNFLFPNFFVDHSPFASRAVSSARSDAGVDPDYDALFADPVIVDSNGEGSLERLLAQASQVGFKGFDWYEWLDSRDSSESTALIGTIPFLRIPSGDAVRQRDEVQDLQFISGDSMFVFWYFNRKF